MTGSVDIFGKRGDGVSMQSHAAMKQAGVGPYEDKPPPVPPPPPEQTTSQIGKIERENSAKLEAALMKRGLTKEQAQSKMRNNERTTGLRYK